MKRFAAACTILGVLVACSSEVGGPEDQSGATEEPVFVCSPQPPISAGKCQNYSFGGTSGVHQFTCCSGCAGTFQGGGSTTDYCHCAGGGQAPGTGGTGGLSDGPSYPEGSSCKTPTNCDTKCTTLWNCIPGNCTNYQNCFSNCMNASDAGSDSGTGAGG